jgi:hypothetical protein
MDRIKTQQYKDRGSRLSWMYVYTTESGRVYEVYYDVSNMGHCREILSERKDGKLVTVWNRECKIGESWKPLVREQIENS